MNRRRKADRRRAAGRRRKRPPRQVTPSRRPPRTQAAVRSGLAVELACRHADGVRVRTRRLQIGRIYRRSAGAGAATVWKGVDHKRLAELATGFAHPQRVILVRTLMQGATSYRQIRMALGAKAGPLYHHVKQLRLCGLLQVGPRDVYRLTEAGQLAAGVLCGLERLLARVR